VELVAKRLAIEWLAAVAVIARLAVAQLVITRLVIVQQRLLIAIAITSMPQATVLVAIAEEVVVLTVAGWL